MSETIIDYFNKNGYSFTRYKGDIGIEIETETLRDYKVPDLSHWTWHQDGSLRNIGKEYVSKGPFERGQNLDDGLGELQDKVISKFNLIPDSNSTGVHFHINFLNNTFTDLWKYLTTYYFVENIFVRIAGPDRRSNLFCQPMCDAEAELETVTGTIRMIGNIQGAKLAISEEGNKYAALNICPITKFGTVESRLLRGTTDIVEIANWARALLALKDYACDPQRTPTSIVNDFDKRGPEILWDMFGDYFKIIKDVPDLSGLMEKNLHYVAKIATASKLTEGWGFPKPKKLYKEKLLSELDRISQELYKNSYKSLPYVERIVVDERLAREMKVDPRQVIFAEGDI